MKKFFAYMPGTDFAFYDISHFAALSAFFAVAFLIWHYRARLRAMKHEKLFRIILAAAVLSIETTFKLWNSYYGKLPLSELLNLDLCYLTLLLTCAMFISGSYRLFEISWLWWFGGVISVFIPIMGDYSYGPDRFRYYHFFIVHSAFIWMNLYMMYVHDFIPTVQSYKRSMFVLLITVIAALILDLVLDLNFMYLRIPPFEAAFIDAIHSFFYPLYVFLFCLLMVVFGIGVTLLPRNLYLRGQKRRPG